ncbi:MAG: class I SAM-dependent methyltransferase [Gammaproteobacteria bacterium]|nr:class I SAM-dependent methyltransferase [Gammaproteobacteria bacterium]
MPSPSRLPAVTLSLAILLTAGCAAQNGGSTPLPVTDARTLAQLEAALAGEHRAAGNPARDLYRHPRETLTFFGLRRDMTVMEVWPGAGGWYTEILAPVLRDKGHYIAASWDPASDSQYVREGRQAFAAKLASRPDLYDRVVVTALQHPGALQPVTPGSVDLVLTFRNLHNWMARDAAGPMLAAIYAALRPGGILGVVEHRAPDSAAQDPQARSGYVREDYAIALAEAAGFELVGSSEINANPRDTKDYPRGVWTLPPTLTLGDQERERYLAIGESDRFTLRFRKPARR